MTEIKIEKLSQEEIESKGINNWPVWEKQVSRFDWYYDNLEMCYILEGSVVVEPEGGEPVEVKAGDFVTFPVGMSCVWDIKENIKKHYKFG